MSSWINRTTVEYIERASPSVMATRYPADVPFVNPGNGNAQSNAAWIHNPSLAAVEGLPHRYWQITGNAVTAVPVPQRQAIDDALQAGRRDAAADRLDDVEWVMRASALVLLDEINTLRDQHSLPPISVANFKADVRAKLGS